MDAAQGETSRQKLRRRGAPALAGLALWLCWTVVVLILFERWPEAAIRLSLLLFGALTCSGLVVLLLFLRREIWRQRRQDLALLQSYRALLQSHNDEMQRLIWLSSRISPRLPLPTHNDMEARPGILNAAWDLIRSESPKRVLELGSGLSSLVMGYALETNGGGKLLALENHVESAAATRLLLSEHRLNSYAQVLDAPLKPVELNGASYPWYTIPDLSSYTPIDLLFVDGPFGSLAPMIRFPALPLLRDYLADDAVILLDDTFREHESQILERWLAAFPDLVVDDRFKSKDFAVLRFSGRNTG